MSTDATSAPHAALQVDPATLLADLVEERRSKRVEHILRSQQDTHLTSSNWGRVDRAGKNLRPYEELELIALDAEIECSAGAVRRDRRENLRLAADDFADFSKRLVPMGNKQAHIHVSGCFLVTSH